MRHDILGKLERHLADCPTREADVVYALVEIRKLLDEADPLPDGDKLKFFCDWSLHTRLDRKLAKNFLRGIDAVLQDDSVLEIFSLQTLLDELRRFCCHHGLPSGWTETPCAQHFLGLYIRIIQDCPLEDRTGGEQGSFIAGATIETVQPSPNLLYAYKWSLSLRDGSSHDFAMAVALPEVQHEE